MKYSAIVLDFDDTLIRSFDNAVKTHQRAAQYLRIRVPERKEFIRILGLPWEDMVEELWPAQDFDELTNAYSKFKTNDGRKKIYGVDEALLELKNSGYTLGILTSRSRETFEEMRNLLKIPDCFKFTITKTESEYRKPDGRVFDKIIADFGKKILYIGDSPIDAKAANNAGIDFIAVLREGLTMKDFYDEGAKKVLNSIRELPDYLGITR